jgi:3alpha(or 20beta)-hydroxysteroid dehydrogenase
MSGDDAGAVDMNPRVALATGAAGGQGWAIAERLRAKGYSVAACDVRAGELVAAVDELGDEDVIAVELDVTSPARWDAVVERVVERFGMLSTLVNCAGALHRASLAEETPEGFETASGQLSGCLPRHAGDARPGCARWRTRPS